jgi:hypothetical protein
LLIRYNDAETGKALVFLTNHFELPALTIAAFYKNRWQVELFFKWIKRHLRIKRFYGTSENAVKTQIWIAGSVSVLVAIIKKRLRLEASLYTLMQVLSVTIFEKMPIQTALSAEISQCDTGIENNQLNLFSFNRTLVLWWRLGGGLWRSVIRKLFWRCCLAFQDAHTVHDFEGELASGVMVPYLVHDLSF